MLHEIFRVGISLRIVLLFFIAVAATVIGLVLGVRLTGNIHEVEPGQLYRSGQLSVAQLSDTISQYGIKSVINLRGASQNQAWYLDELAVSAKLGVRHFDLALSATREPKPEELAQLERWFSEIPRPILIHCEAGADRSGLAAALYELVIARRSRQVAERQLSLWYGHFPWLLSRTGAMDRALAQFEINPSPAN